MYSLKQHKIEFLHKILNAVSPHPRLALSAFKIQQRVSKGRCNRDTSRVGGAGWSGGGRGADGQRSASAPPWDLSREPGQGPQLGVPVRIQSLFVLDCWKTPTEPRPAAQSAFPGCGLDDIFPNLFNKHRVRTILFG